MALGIESTMSLRIMHISTRLIHGGSQENTLLTCQGQRDRGHQVALVHGPIHGPEGSLASDVPAGIERMESPHLVRDPAPLREWRCERDLRRLIRDWKPDVVHTHSSKAGILGRRAAWAERVRAVVHTVHGMPFHRHQAWPLRKLYVALERHAAKRCHALPVVSWSMRDQMLAAGVGTPEQYHLVRSGMEVNAFQKSIDSVATRAAYGLDPDHMVIGTVSRIADLKGHDDLLHAIAPLMRQDQRLRLLWVGDGWRKEARLGLARELGIANRIVVTGMVGSSEIPALIQSCDLLVHPSYREGLPRVVVQAMLTGVPVVATDADGTREVCIPEKTGRLVPIGNVDALRSACQDHLDRPQLSQQFAEQAKELVRADFTQDAMVDALETLYAKLLA